jgi:signal transduction histidine kinase
MSPRTLRSQLLLSYVAVILAGLLIVALALFGYAGVSNARLLPSLERLSAISRTNQRELLDLWQAGATGDELQTLLTNTAEQTGVRILVVDADVQQVIFDTVVDDDWVGDPFTEVERPPSLVMTDTERDTLFGTFIHLDGSPWLVFSEHHPALGRAYIFYAEPEPTAGEFFSAYFLRPLLFAGALAFLLAVLLAALVARSVVRPLQNLAVAAGAVARGDYDQRVPPRGPEEVRDVAESFNSMAAQVNATQTAQRDLVANVSHDLKTPLTAISGWSQALLDGTAGTPDERRRAAETIFNEAGRMSRLVNDLLDLARLESGQFQLTQRSLDLGQVMADVERGLLPRARDREIELSLDLSPTPPVLGDRDRLVQVFTNLADNALTYTPSGGRVGLAVRAVNGAVEGIVSDTGAGIPEEELPRVFERFYRLEKSRVRGEDGRRGSGLGLAIVEELVHAHGGRISVSSRVGEGTTFVVSLPTAPADAGS